MPNILKVNSFSLNIKVSLALFLVSFILFSVLFLLVIPKMHKEQLEYTKNQIEKMILITKEQVSTAGKSITIQTVLEKSETKYRLELALMKIKENSFDMKSTINQIDKSILGEFCSYHLSNNDFVKTDTTNKSFINALKTDSLDSWQTHEFDTIYRSLDRKRKFLSYTKKLNFDDTRLTIFCSNSNLNKNHASFEKGIKINVQNAFSLMEKFHKGKSYLMWINPKLKDDDTRPLYESDDTLRKERYSISNMSNVSNIYTGDLTTKQIVQNIDKEPILHDLNGKDALTWIRDLSSKEDKSYIFLLVTTVYIEDLHNHIDSAFWKIFPASFTALILALLAGFFLFKRLFKGINTLAQTAREVNLGNKNIRSHVRGNDDIGNLGLAFDSMLDSLQRNIKTLDFKVEKKTEELKKSLEEKELLLKEIHHRVKNNLALTIGLIKLQQDEIKDKKSQKVLVDIQERIYTMELLHRKLYESSNLDHINFKEYVINLVHDIELSYSSSKQVDIKIDVEDIYLNIEKAMPCGLILNELITNSFKYAFNDKKNAKLKISMKFLDGEYILIVKDNGKAIPKDVDVYTSNTLGLRLVNTISKLQLKGNLKYKNKNGAFFKVVFK